jgi:hypothetical protein
MTPQEVTNYYGNKIKAAAEIGVSLQTIHNWFSENKIPRLSQLAIQTLTKNKLKADGE